jgi:hypothetical protein
MLLGEACLLEGRPGEATCLALKGLDLARRQGARGSQAHILQLLGAIAAHPDFPEMEAAEGRYREALDLSNQLGMRPLVAHCHLGLGKLYRSADKRQEAQKHLTTAATMYREMGMTFWLEKAEAAIESPQRDSP